MLNITLGAGAASRYGACFAKTMRVPLRSTGLNNLTPLSFYFAVNIVPLPLLRFRNNDDIVRRNFLFCFRRVNAEIISVNCDSRKRVILFCDLGSFYYCTRL
jgi:hypothetical protein